MKRVRHAAADVGRMALPITMGMVSGAITALIDTAFVGSLGTEPLAALAIGNGVTFPLFLGAFAGIATATQILVARTQASPLQDRNAPFVVLRTTLLLGGVISLLLLLGLTLGAETVAAAFTDEEGTSRQAAGYITGSSLGAPATAIVGICRNYRMGMISTRDYLRGELLIQGANIAFDYIFIFGHLGMPEMGVEGAALGTAGSRWVGAFFWILALFRERVWRRVHSVRPSARTAREATSLALPLSAHLLSALLASGPALLAVVAMLGTSELAAAHVLIRITRFATLVGAGVGTAAVSFVASNTGYKHAQQKYTGGAVLLSILTTLPLTAVLLVAPETILSLFAASSSVVEVAVWPLRVVALTLSLNSVGIVLERCWQGAGYEKQVLVFTVLLHWGVLVLGSWSALMLTSGNLLLIWYVWTLQRLLRCGIYGFLWLR